jgi:hypothetical protein
LIYRTNILKLAALVAFISIAGCSSEQSNADPQRLTDADIGTDSGDDIGDLSDSSSEEVADLSRDTNGADDIRTGFDSTDTSAEADVTSPELDYRTRNYCELTAKMFCQFYIRCDRISTDSLETCRKRFTETCNTVFEPRYLELRRRGDLRFSESGLKTCRQHLNRVSCKDHIRDLEPPCDAMWRGRVSDGGSCSGGLGRFVCEKGTACNRDRSICGTCRQTADVGSFCDGETPCEQGSTCVDGECVAFAQRGDSCGDTAPCVPGTSCENGICEPYQTVQLTETCNGRERRCPVDSICAGGTCKKQALAGEACSPGLCASGICEDRVCKPYLSKDSQCNSSRRCLASECKAGTCGSAVPTCEDN